MSLSKFCGVDDITKKIYGLIEHSVLHQNQIKQVSKKFNPAASSASFAQQDES
jgi:hypothetical protein